MKLIQALGNHWCRNKWASLYWSWHGHTLMSWQLEIPHLAFKTPPHLQIQYCGPVTTFPSNEPLKFRLSWHASNTMAITIFILFLFSQDHIKIVLGRGVSWLWKGHNIPKGVWTCSNPPKKNPKSKNPMSSINCILTCEHSSHYPHQNMVINVQHNQGITQTLLES